MTQDEEGALQLEAKYWPSLFEFRKHFCSGKKKNIRNRLTILPD